MRKALLALVLAVLTIEAAALAAVYLREGFFVPTRARPDPTEARASTAAAPTPTQGDFITKVSPYFAYTWRPGQSVHEILDWNGRAAATYRARTGAETQPDWATIKTNNFGFYADDDYPTAGGRPQNGRSGGDDASYVVALFGGSVAQWLWLQSGPRLADAIARLPMANGRQVVLLNFAMSGYKQPAQQQVLAYFLSLGQRFDLVINLDGFNEAALGATNDAVGLDVSLPGHAFMQGLRERMATVHDDDAVMRLAHLARAREAKQTALRDRAAARTATGYLWASMRVSRTEARLDALRDAVPPALANERGLLHLPVVPDHGVPAVDRIVAQWRRSSEIMAAVTSVAEPGDGGVGRRYVHVLQPNQYATQRTLAPAERAIAIARRADHPYRLGVEATYPLMRQAGQTLVEAGIAFVDGDAAFEGIREPVYADRCCHYNQRGNDALADFIAHALAPSP